jgi:hypothetical protein
VVARLGIWKARFDAYKARAGVWLNNEVEWARGTRVGRRWVELPRRTQQLIGAVASVGCVVIVAVGLILVPPSLSQGAHAAATGSSQVAVASVSPSESAAFSVMPSSSPSATEDPGAPKAPAILASVDCGASSVTAVAKGVLYVPCRDATGADARILAINLSSDKVQTTFKLGRTTPKCVPGCGPPPYVYAITVGRTLDVSWEDYGFQSFNLTSGKEIGKLTFTNEDSSLVWDVRVNACGSLWDLQEPANENREATISRLDPKSGRVLWTSLLNGGYDIFTYRVEQIGAGCWVIPDVDGPTSITRLTPACMAAQAMTVPGAPFALGGSAWVITKTGLAQFDLAAGSTYGRTWLLSERPSPILAVSGHVWAGVGDKFERLDLPTDPIPNQAPLPTIQCAAPAPTASSSPTASPTPSPSATPTASPTPTSSPTPNPTPTPTSTPTPTPSAAPSQEPNP